MQSGAKQSTSMPAKFQPGSAPQSAAGMKLEGAGGALRAHFILQESAALCRRKKDDREICV